MQAPHPYDRKTQMTQFEGIVPALGLALEKRGYTDLTPVQVAMLAPELANADALVSAQTGSGKTVAFGIALAPTLLGDAARFSYVPAPLALIVTPTRELAMQVQRELQWLYAETGANIASCVGGMDFRAEKRALDHGAHIVVGTPGRLRDHIERGSLDMTGLRAAVLDEADEMLDLGFRDDLEFILQSAPEDRRTLMFSATVSKPIATLAQSYQRNAVRVATAGERRQHVDIEYRALQVASADRENAIINVLRFYEAKNALVFCSTRAAVNHLMARFNNRGFAVVALSGELSQNERSHAIQAMRDGRARVCIATDVAARGLDLPGLELVIHADLPGNRETLLHRSGRTGRAGNKGVSAIIVAPSDRKKAERLLAAAAINATWAKAPSADEVTAKDNERMLSLPALLDPVAEDEAALVSAILGAHNPDQVAAAFVRLWREGRSAPEELRDAAEAPKRVHAEFGPSVWLSLSVGRSQNAEPRWLLPMLCTAGGITKTEIGAIRMLDDETHVQLTAASAPGFLQALGPELALEKGIKVQVLAEAPESANARPQAPRVFARSEEDAPRRTYKPRDDAASTAAERPAPARKPRDPDAPKRVYVSKSPDADQTAPEKPSGDRVAPEPSIFEPADDFEDRPRRVYPPKTQSPDAPKRPFDRPRSLEAAKKPFAAKSRANDGAVTAWEDRPRADKPRYDGPRNDGPRNDGPRNDGPKYAKPFGDKARPDRPFADRVKPDGSAGPRPAKAWAGKPATDRPGADRPATGKPWAGKPASSRPGADKPWADKPRAKPAFDPADPSASRRKPGAKPSFGKPSFGQPKPAGKPFARPGADGPKRPKPKG